MANVNNNEMSVFAKKYVPLQPELSPLRLGEVCTDVRRLAEKPLKYK